MGGGKGGTEVAFKLGFSKIFETVSRVERRNQGGIPCVYERLSFNPTYELNFDSKSVLYIDSRRSVNSP